MEKTSEVELQKAIIVLIRSAMKRNKSIVIIQQLGVSLENEAPTNWEISIEQI